jgi:hypothetical protein
LRKVVHTNRKIIALDISIKVIDSAVVDESENEETSAIVTAVCRCVDELRGKIDDVESVLPIISKEVIEIILRNCRT